MNWFLLSTFLAVLEHSKPSIQSHSQIHTSSSTLAAAFTHILKEVVVVVVFKTVFYLCLISKKRLFDNKAHMSNLDFIKHYFTMEQTLLGYFFGLGVFMFGVTV